MRVTLQRAIAHRCPFTPETDEGTVLISYDDAVIELHGLARFLDSFEDAEITHEDLTRSVAAWLDVSVVAPNALVTTYWRTAGFDVTVTA